MVTRTLLVGLLLLMAVGAQGQVMPTDQFKNFFSGNTTYNGNPVPVGSIIDAYDPDSVHCGRFVVHTEGNYGFMPVYGDDPTTTGVDEGAITGDMITFKINGRDATVVSGNTAWAHQTQDTVDLDVAAAVISLTEVDPPDDQLGAFSDTARFEIGIRNDGNGTDFYGVRATVDQTLWTVITPDSMFYNEVGDTTWVYFDVDLDWADAPNDTVGLISYEVYSMIDTTEMVTGNVNLILSVTDVGDDQPDGLPVGFALYQNYPNPFNPTTTIGFSLPMRSSVRLEVYNTLGRQVDRRDLGVYAAGDHQIDYDASLLASGVYFYRLVTEEVAMSRKMILVK